MNFFKNLTTPVVQPQQPFSYVPVAQPQQPFSYVPVYTSPTSSKTTMKDIEIIEGMFSEEDSPPEKNLTPDKTLNKLVSMLEEYSPPGKQMISNKISPIENMASEKGSPPINYSNNDSDSGSDSDIDFEAIELAVSMAGNND